MSANLDFFSILKPVEIAVAEVAGSQNRDVSEICTHALRVTIWTLLCDLFKSADDQDSILHSARRPLHLSPTCGIDAKRSLLDRYDSIFRFRAVFLLQLIVTFFHELMESTVWLP